jgi:hypothetical protein
VKPKHLWILAAVVVVLLVARVLVERGAETARDLEEAGLARIVPEDFDAASVGWIRVSGPGEDGSKLELRRAGEGWSVTSAHDAPGEAEAIDEFLESLARARGELRGDGRGLFAEFGVDDASAARLELGASPGEVDVALLLGKQGDGPQSHFVRAAEGEAIRHVARGLLAGLGLSGEARQPAADRWVDKTVLEVEEDAVARIAAERPDQRWVLEKEPAAEEPETTTDESGAGAEPPSDEPGWRVLEPALDWPVSSWGPSGVVSRLARLSATTVLDPAQEACSDAALPLTVAFTAEGEERLLRIGDRLLDGDVVAVRLDGGPTCYGLTKWTAESLLPKASRLFQAPKPLGEEPPPAEEFTRLEIQRGDETIRLARSDEGWRLQAPQAGEADGPRVDRLVSALRFLSWDDLALESALTEEAKAVHATLEARAGNARWTLRLLGERVGSSGGERYAVLEGGGGVPEGLVGTVSASSVGSLLPALDELVADDPEG